LIWGAEVTYTSISHRRSRPLDDALGSDANVRLLRVLTMETPGPMNAEEAARRTGLTPPGARKGLERLVVTGLVHRVGAGRQKQFALNRDHPLTEAIERLFDAEARRFGDLLNGLRSSFGTMPEIRGAWIVDSPSDSGAAVRVALVAEPSDLSWIGAEARRRVTEVERSLDQVVEIETYTRADAPIYDPATSIPLAGVITGQDTVLTGKPMTHEEIDRRSLETARAIAELIRDDPSIITRAKRRLDDLLRSDQGMAAGDLAEWRLLLDTYSTQRVQEFLASSSQRAQRLRSSSPFLPVLSPDERTRLSRYLAGSG
jgi:DNA-binding Lrp family transcriptional regulator